MDHVLNVTSFRFVCIDRTCVISILIRLADGSVLGEHALSHMHRLSSLTLAKLFTRPYNKIYAFMKYYYFPFLYPGHSPSWTIPT
jgi:hypothetical protein